MIQDDPTIPTHILGDSLRADTTASSRYSPSPSPSREAQFSTLLSNLRLEIQAGRASEADLLHLMNCLPQEVTRKLVYRYAGMDASFLTSLTKQVQLVDAVLNNLIEPDGRLKPSAVDLDISLKDALTLSTRVTQMLLRDLPRLYTVDRLQRMERALGDVMDEYFSEEQQQKVLIRLQELTSGQE